MRDIIRVLSLRRFAFAIFICLLSIAFCLAQETPRQEVVKVAATPPAPETGTAATQAVKTPEAADAKPADSQQADSKPGGAAPSRPAAAAPAPGPPKGSARGGEVTATGVQEEPYKIGPDDVLAVNVLHQPDVSGLVVVRPDGFISVRFAGEIKAAGLTTQQLSDIITDKLTQYFNHPEVIIQVQAIRSKKYYVDGLVKKPGAYNLGSPTTVLQALIEAGGLADFAKGKKIYILRGGKQRFPFNYVDVSKGLHLEQNILLQDGDFIKVP